MNGKLILKRKHDRQQSISGDSKRERIECEPQQQQRPSVISEVRRSPPPSPPLSQRDPVIVPNTRNKILLEALQKIVELQKELDDFENELDYNDEHGFPEDSNDDSEISFILNDHHDQAEQEQYQRHEAEALGFAMCARETLLFLQQEGISQDSVVYQTLREKLVGQLDDNIPI